MAGHILLNLLLQKVFPFIPGMPSKDDITAQSYVKDNKLYIKVTLVKVHPLPSCSLQYHVSIQCHIK